MQKNWNDFINLYDNEQLARNAFTELCEEIALKHYPELHVIESATIEENASQSKNDDNKNTVIYLAKFFTDHLSNSRKGQIRKAFNDNSNYIKSGKQVEYWSFFIAYSLNEEEKTWWQGWKERTEKEYKIKIKIIESDKIFELLHKFDIYNKWFQLEEPKKEEIKKEQKEEEDDDFFELIDDIEIEKSDKKEDIDDEQKIENKQAQKNKEKTDQKPEIEKTSKGKTVKNKNIYYSLEKFKEQYLKINKLIDSLEEYELIAFNKRRLNSRFKELSAEAVVPYIDKISPADLMYKARLNRINENHEKALYIYEYLIKNDLIPYAAKSDVLKGKELAENTLIYKNNLIEGDLYFCKKDFVKALYAYEIAIQTDNSSTEIARKYYECFAEALIEQANYSEAKKMLEKAIKAEPKNAELADRMNFVEYMIKIQDTDKKGIKKFINNISSPFNLIKAQNLAPDDPNIKKQKKRILKKSLVATAWIAVLAIVSYGVVLLVQNINFNISPVKKHYAKKVVLPYDLQMQKGEHYLNNLSNDKVHYYDSAMVCFKRALNYKPHDTIAPYKYEQVMRMKESYIRTVQMNIKTDSARYFLSMRDPTEGLRLFKYYYAPDETDKGKFGYVDTNLNVVIPPIYDFNFRRMYQKGEMFKDGRALVCLIVAPGDTTYFYIDKFGKKIH